MLVNSIDAKKKFLGHIKRCRARKDALGNQIEMRMTFEEWCAVWEESGQWHNRRKGGAVMSRHNDIGHYEVGNVSIKSAGENVAEARRGKAFNPKTIEKLRSSNKQAWTDKGLLERHAETQIEIWKHKDLEEHSRKVSAARSTESSRSKSAEANKLTWADPEVRAKRSLGISKALKGRKLSLEQRAKISASLRKRYEDRRRATC